MVFMVSQPNMETSDIRLAEFFEQHVDPAHTGPLLVVDLGLARVIAEQENFRARWRRHNFFENQLPRLSTSETRAAGHRTAESM